MKNLTHLVTFVFSFVFFAVFSQTSYTTPGTYTWTVPPCVTSITVKVWGAGGGGGGAIAIVRSGDGSEACSGAGGGGGGGYSSRTFAVIPGQTYNVVVGAGGLAGAQGNGTYNSGITTPAGPGGTGGLSSFVGNSYNIVANGGTGGGAAGSWSNNAGSGVCVSANGTAGVGGNSSGGTTNFNGGNGAVGLILYESTDKSGGGGGAAGPGGNGGNATAPGSVGISNPPGGVGQAPGGNGGNGFVHNIPSNQAYTGNNGATYGGAGGGALIHRGTYNVGRAPGGIGANGAVLIEYSAGGAPADPVVAITPATCLAAGSASISNYNAGNSYVFSPVGPSVGGSGVISNATPGTAYTVTSNNGSCDSNPIAFTVPTQLPAPATPTLTTSAATCSSAGSTTITNYNAGNSYVFSPVGPSAGAGGVISNATAGVNYTVSASSGGCTSATAPFANAIQLPTPTDPVVSITPATCLAAGSASISNYNAGNSYVFSPVGPSVGGSGAISNATPGTAYTVTSNNGTCDSNPIAFTVPTQLPAPATPTLTTSAATCSSAGSTTITNYNAGNSYVFSPVGPSAGAGGVISNATAGVNYTVSASSGGCTSATAPFTNAIQLPTPTDPVVSITPATCLAAGSASISNYNAGNSYVFSPVGPSVGGSGAISNATPGTAYTVTSNNGSCDSNPIAFTVPTQLPAPATPTLTTSAATCSSAGSTTITNYNAGNSYVFSPVGPSAGAGGVISNATAGVNYTVSASSGGCTSATVPFTNPEQLPGVSAPIVTTTPASCLSDGISTITNYDSNLSYTFSPVGPSIGGNGVISGATVGVSYTVEASISGCTSPQVSFLNDEQLTVPAQPSTIVGNINLPCGASNETYSVTNESGVSYLWTYTGNATLIGSGNSVVLNPISSGGTLTVSPSNSCGDGIPQSIVITISTLQLTVVSTTPSCTDTATGTAVVSVANGTAPYQYVWNPTGGTAASANHLAAGTYTVTATDALGCSQQIQVVISAFSTIDPVVNATQVNCANSSLGTATSNPIGGTSPYSYQWQNGQTSQTITNLTVGTYQVVVTDAEGCHATGTATVSMSNNLGLTISPNSATIVEGDSVSLVSNLVPAVNGAVYAWSPATALTCSNCPNPTASPTETTTYTLTVTTPAGCVIDTNITIVVEKLCADLIFPNIFTPNGDKTNDYYEIDTKCLSEFTHWIVNRWGNTMFRTSEMNVFWDGLVEGNPASEGIYFINYIGIKSNGEPIKGQTFFHLDR